VQVSEWSLVQIDLTGPAVDSTAGGEAPLKVLVLSPVLSLFLAVRFWFSRGTMIC